MRTGTNVPAPPLLSTRARHSARKSLEGRGGITHLLFWDRGRLLGCHSNQFCRIPSAKCLVAPSSMTNALPSLLDDARKDVMRHELLVVVTCTRTLSILSDADRAGLLSVATTASSYMFIGGGKVLRHARHI